MAYVYIPYPRWKYSAKGKCIVQNAEEEAALGDGWYDTPAKIPQGEPVKAEPVEEQPRVDAPMEIPVRRGPGRPRRMNGHG